MMNVSTRGRDLVPFFSIKKPTSTEVDKPTSNEVDLSYGSSMENFSTTSTTDTNSASYKIYAPTINYYIGSYLGIIGK